MATISVEAAAAIEIRLIRERLIGEQLYREAVQEAAEKVFGRALCAAIHLG
jgi:hypothetical protein